MFEFVFKGFDALEYEVRLRFRVEHQFFGHSVCLMSPHARLQLEENNPHALGLF